MKNENVDLLIVVWNQVDYLKDCIESVQRHSPGCRLFLWNNGSDDKTRAYLNSLKDAVVVHYPQNIGDIIPNNRLLSLGTGEYVAMLNSDNIVEAGWLDPLKEALDQGYCCAGYDCCRLTPEFQGYSVTDAPIHYVRLYGCLMRRSWLEEHGLLDEWYEFFWCVDADSGLRWTKAGGKLCHVKPSRVRHVGGVTMNAVNQEVVKYFYRLNHEKLKTRWAGAVTH